VKGTSKEGSKYPVSPELIGLFVFVVIGSACSGCPASPRAASTSSTWSTLSLEGGPTNLLASGGIRGEIRLFHPQHKVYFHEWRPVNKKNTAVNFLVFHTGEPTWLFCGTNNGVVSLSLSAFSLHLFDSTVSR
jgi:hypothetical protein